MTTRANDIGRNLAIRFDRTIRQSSTLRRLKGLPGAKAAYYEGAIRLLSSRSRRRFVSTLAENLDSRTLEDQIDYSYSAEGGLIAPCQVRSEWVSLVTLLAEEPPKRFLEIGTANGGTLFGLCRVADPLALGISIDLPPGRLASYPLHRRSLYRSFAGPGQALHLLKADSHAPSARAVVLRLLEGHQLDLLFLDGDHTYDGVKMDFEQYRELVRPGGLIAFHDIVERPDMRQCDVARFWREVRVTKPSQEFIERPGQTEWGIGILHV